MITHVYVSNYGSVCPAVELELGALTALVGPEGSGKSTLVDVLRFLVECVTGSLERAVADRRRAPFSRMWGETAVDTLLGVAVSKPDGHGFWLVQLGPGEREGDVRVKHETAAWWQRSALTRIAKPGLKEALDGGGEQPEVVFDRLKGSPKGFSRREVGRRGALTYRGLAPVAVTGTRLLLPLIKDSALTPMVDELRGVALFTLPPSTLRAPQRVSAIRRLAPHGENWASILRRVDQEPWKGALLDVLHRIGAGVDGLRVMQHSGLLTPELRRGLSPDGRERWSSAAMEPDSALWLAAVATALAQEPVQTLLGLERPESMVDAAMLPALLATLREASIRRQILLSTSSAAVLGHLSSADQVYALELRGAATEARRVAEPERALDGERSGRA